MTCKLKTFALICGALLLSGTGNLHAQTDTLIVSDSSEYAGQYPVGKGVLYSMENGIIIGEFVRGVPEGTGVHYLPDGSIYCGSFSGGRHDGYGRFFSDSGKVLAGEFRNDYANGLDTLWYPDGYIYVGMCRNGRPVSSRSPEYGRLYGSLHAPAEIVSAKPVFHGPELTESQRDFLDEAGRQYRKLVRKDTPPKFKGRDADAFSRWVASRLRYPDTEDRSGGMKTVLVKFGVDQDGNTYIVEIIESPGKAFSDEAVRVIESSPAWSPGIYKGKKVKTTYTIPVVFR